MVDAHTRVLILGSLPGEASLAQAQYYAYKHNQFWRLVGEVIGEDLPAMAYDARLQALLAHRIGLWDVVAEAKREGSLDSKIRDHAGNDLAGLIASLPELAVIAFNGKTAARIGMQMLGEMGDRHAILQLPSSSPAYTMAYADKLHAWRPLRAWSGQSEPAGNKPGTVLR